MNWLLWLGVFMALAVLLAVSGVVDRLLFLILGPERLARSGAKARDFREKQEARTDGLLDRAVAFFNGLFRS